MHPLAWLSHQRDLTGCPIPQGSRFIRFAFRFTTSWSAHFYKAVVSI